MRIKYIFCFVVTILLIACNKETAQKIEDETMESTEQFHGYIFIGCENPPYHLKLDSLIANCSELGILPDSIIWTLPVQTTVIGEFSNACGIDNNKGVFGDENNYDIRVMHEGYTISLESPISGVTIEDIPIELDSITYEAGEHPYLGGYRVMEDEWELTIQAVNYYIGGCYHNLLIWEIINF